MTSRAFTVEVADKQHPKLFRAAMRLFVGNVSVITAGVGAELLKALKIDAGASLDEGREAAG